MGVSAEQILTAYKKDKRNKSAYLQTGDGPVICPF